MSRVFLAHDRPTGALHNLSWRDLGLVGLTALPVHSTGVSWQAQRVSYPLFHAVAPQDFVAYHAQYNASIPVVVIVPGFLSFVAGAAFLWTHPSELPRLVASTVSAAGATAFVATVARAIPMHGRLSKAGQDAETIDALLSANLVRSVALTVETAALCGSLAHILRH